MLFYKRSVSAGLYVGSRSYVYLELDGADGGRVAASSSGELPRPFFTGGSLFSAGSEELSEIFRFVSSSVKHARRRRVHFALPMAESLLRVASMPGLTRSEARKAFRYELDRHFPFGDGECVYDLDEIEYPSDGGSSERRFSVAAARRKPVEAVLDAARSRGFRFASVEPEQTAVERAVSFGGTCGGGRVLLYAGVDNALVIFLWRGNGIFYKTVPYGECGATLDERAAALAGGVRASVEFGLSRNGGFVFDSLTVFGPLASGRLRAAIEGAFPECGVSEAFPERRFGMEFPAEDGWIAALGLALRDYDRPA